MPGRVPKDSYKPRLSLRILALRELSANQSVYLLPEDRQRPHQF